MAEDSPWHEKDTYIRLAIGVLTAVLGCVLYLVATFGLGERGPGGTLCVAALGPVRRVLRVLAEA